MQNGSALKRIPKSIWALGFVSLFMDVSSELVHSLLPVFMVTVMGTSVVAVGIIEGIAEATPYIIKVFSGALSDYLGKRKIITLVGYGIAAVTKPFFPLAETIGMVFSARFIDRIGKGIRGAPRDALISEIAPPDIRGACFGLRQALDTVGAIIGPLLAIIFMFVFLGDMRKVMWIAVIPALIAVFILVFYVSEPDRPEPVEKIQTPMRWKKIPRFGAAYWELVAIAAVLTLARFSEAFLVLEAQEAGLPLALVPGVMIVMNIAYAFIAYPIGALSDRAHIGRTRMVCFGMGFLIVADVVIGCSDNLWMLALGAVLWGLHMAFTQGVLAAMVTDTTPPHWRGTAYGVYSFITGIVMLIASVLAGYIWDHYGSSATFFTGAAFSAAALVGLLLFQYMKARKARMAGGSISN
ncbi:MAG: MFS transporter [Alphaproteobacteria bacterium]|nr:MFS transporter [Alphaproteobacteria bacterium]